MICYQDDRIGNTAVETLLNFKTIAQLQPTSRDFATFSGKTSYGLVNKRF